MKVRSLNGGAPLKHESFTVMKTPRSPRGPQRIVCLTEEPTEAIFQLSAAFVGFEAAVSLRDFVQKYEYQVSVEDILDRGEFDKIEKWGINDHAAMVEKMEHASTFSESLSDTQVTNLATWFVTMPSEICMKLWSAIGDAEDENGTNAIRLHKASAADGTRVSEHMVKILRGS
mgnify:CR=1 FL=1